MKWYLLHTAANSSERNLREKVECCPHVSEAYYPLTHKPSGKNANICADRPHPLLPSIVFVRASYPELKKYIEQNYIPGGFVLDSQRDVYHPMVIPDEEMQQFRNVCDNYDQKILYLDKTYSAFTDCDIITISDGIFKGLKGKFKEIKRDYKLIMQIGQWTVALSNIQRYTLTVDYMAPKDKEQNAILHTIDYFLARLQAAGYKDDADIQLRKIISSLNNGMLPVDYITKLNQDHDTGLLSFVNTLTAEEKTDLRTLAGHLLINPSLQFDKQIPRCPLRPFLTIESGSAEPIQNQPVKVKHTRFTEIIYKEKIKETYLINPLSDNVKERLNTYYSHVADFIDPITGIHTLITNWTGFYSHYLSMGTGEEHDKFIQKLRKYNCTTFLALLSQEGLDGIKFITIPCNQTNGYTITGLGLTTSQYNNTAIRTLIDISQRLCTEIIGNTHLLPWRRYLSTVWLRQ